jgi:hypothetical protein
LSGSESPYVPFNEPNPSVYTSYDIASICGHYFTGQWLKEVEHFSESAYENIWGPVGQTVAPLIGAGVWASSDIHLITDCGSNVWRWGLLETFDTPYRIAENVALPDNFGRKEFAKRKIIAPIGRYALQSVDECWNRTVSDPFPSTWHSGDLANFPFYISCGVNDTLSKTITLIGYTFSYGGSENPPDEPDCKPTPFSSGADIWFRTKYYHNIYDQICYQWKVECGTSGVQKIAAIYYWNSSLNEWTIGDCSYSNSASIPAIAEYCVPGDCNENRPILFYLWTSTANCTPMFSLSLN